MQCRHGLVLHETMYGSGAYPQRPGDGFEEPEPKPEDVLGRPCLNSKGFWAEGGSLAVCCSALKETTQYPGESFLLDPPLGGGGRSLALCPVSAVNFLEWLCLCLQ